MRKSTGGRLSRTILFFSLASFIVLHPVAGQTGSGRDAEVASLITRLRMGSSAEKTDAAAQLAALGPYASAAVPELAAALSSDDLVLQYEALIALSHIGPMAGAAVPAITEVLSSKAVPLQVTALNALRQIGTSTPEVLAQIKELAADTNDATTAAAVRCLINTGHSDDPAVAAAVPRLVGALSHSKASVKNAAATALVEIGPAVLPELKVLLSSSDRILRRQACEMAGRMEEAAHELVPELTLRLIDQDEAVVRAAATALGRMQADAVAVVPRLEGLLSRESPALRTDVLSALSSYGHLAQEAVPKVSKLLENESIIVRVAAARTLGQIGSGSAAAAEALSAALNDEHGGVTIQAATSLGLIGPVALPALVELMAAPEYRDLAIAVLGEMGPAAETAVPNLMAELKTAEDEELQREIFIALAMIGPGAKAAVPELMNLLSSPGSGLARAGAAYVLGNIGEQSCVPMLQQVLNDPSETDPIPLRAAAWALVMLQPDQSKNAKVVLPHLIRALSAERPLAQKEALSAISLLGEAALSAMNEILELAGSDPDPTVRAEALHTLGVLPVISDEALPIAVAALDADEPNVRNSARFLLGKLGTRASLAASKLRSATREGAELDRVIASWALFQVAPSEEHKQIATPFMVKALQYPNPQMRAEAARTLGAIGIGSPDVTAALSVAADDSDQQVSKAASEALKALETR